MTKEKRNETIYNLWLRGWAYSRIGERYGLSMSSVTKIIAAQKELYEWSGSRAA
jgi:uncharacterized protein YjcR